MSTVKTAVSAETEMLVAAASAINGGNVAILTAEAAKITPIVAAADTFNPALQAAHLIQLGP